MSTPVQLTDIQLVNLMLLCAAKRAVTEDPIRASHKFSLGPGQVAYIEKTSIDQLQSRGASLSQCIFVPPSHLVQILSASPSVARLNAAAILDLFSNSVPFRP